MIEAPKDAAIQFEGLKLGISDMKDGLVLRLAVNPQDAPSDLWRMPRGTRFMVVMVPIDDNEEPIAGPETRDGILAVQQAATLCKNERFQKWLVSEMLAVKPAEQDAIEAVREYCGIESRAELKTNEVARKIWNKLKDNFEYAYAHQLVEK